MATPEIPKNSPASTPAKAPDDTLLKNFRATLEARWGEFDAAAIQEAGLFSGMRDADKKYQQAKKAFDEAKKMLASIQNDTELKVNTQVLETVESTLKALTDHLKEIKPEEKNKAINIILAKTTADLSQFKADITGKEEDKKQAEVAIAAEKAIPRTAVVAASTAGGFSLMSSADAADGLSSAVSEGAQDLGKEVAAIKKNPMKKIAEFLGFTDSSIASDIKAALAEKKAGGFDGFFASIKLWFYGLMAKFTGADLSASLTPEEMRLAGIKGKVAEGVKPGVKDEAREAGNTALTIVSYKGFARIFIQPMIDTTGKQKFFTYPQIDQLITVEGFRNKPFSEIVKIYEKYKNSSDKNGLKNEFGITDSNISVDLLFFVIERICSGKGREYIDKHAIAGGDTNMTIGGIFSRLHKNMHIAEKFDTLKPSKPITGPSDIGEFLSEIGTKLDMPLENPTAILENVDYQSSLKDLGVDASMLGYIVTNKKSNIKDISADTIKESTITSEGGKESMKKMLDFWSKFQNTISDNFSFGNSEKFKEFFKKNGVTLGDVFRLYVITGGNPDYGSMNHAQQAYIYMKLWGILSVDGDFRGKYFNQPLISALFDAEANIKLPEGVKNIIGTLFNNAAESTLNKIGGFISEVWNTLDARQKAIFISSLGAGLVLLWYLRPLRYIGMGVAATVIAGATGTAIAAMWPNTDKIKIKDTEYTKDALKNKLVGEISNLGVQAST